MPAPLTRFDTSDQGTFGALTVEGFTFLTLELPWRDNESSISSIPSGTYEVALTFSPRFNRKMYEVLGVPNRVGIRIHPANFAGDKDLGFVSQLNGCIALGKMVATVPTSNGIKQKALLTSAPAVAEFEALLAGKPFTLEIT